MPGQFVGFYWTLPINWANFRFLPRDVEAAAAKSRTIRYQMHAVRRWVAEQKGQLLKEIVFLEASPDRGTEAVRAELEAVRKLCLPDRAELVYVEFEAAFGWRRHPHLLEFIQEHQIPFVPLPPEPVILGGRRFDPIEHFQQSRDRHDRKVVSLRDVASRALMDTAMRYTGRAGDYQSISDELNAGEIRTPTGRLWTAEVVRKTLKRRGFSFGNLALEAA